MSQSNKNNLLFNQEINKHLERLIQSKLFSNGYIFYGPEGVGKKETALKFVEGILNEYSFNSNLKKTITNNNHPDFLCVEPTHLIKGKMFTKSASDITIKNHLQIIRIEQIRNIKTFLAQKSIESEKKIVLIIDAHLLNEAASNCLLKILEEPSNGIFILITPKINLLLETITSRCQLVRFKSFSCNEVEIFLKQNLDISMSEVYKKLDSQDLINSANGSPKKVLNNIQIWSSLSKEITDNLDSPPNNSLEILKISKLISEQLEIHQQIVLINFIQLIWWKKTKNASIIKKLENLKVNIKNLIQPRLAWEVAFLEIFQEGL